MLNKKNDGINVNYIKEEQKKLRKQRRKKISKGILITFMSIFTIVYLVGLTIVGLSVEYKESIYDEYTELDKETSYLLKSQMKKLTNSKNVYVHFLVVYKDVEEEFFEGKFDTAKKYVAVLYNAMEETLSIQSNIEYLYDNMKQENISDLSENLPKYFSRINDSIKENIYLFDYTSLTGAFTGKEEFMVSAVIFGGGLLAICWILVMKR